MSYIQSIIALLIASAPMAFFLVKVYFKNKDLRIVNGQKLRLNNHSINRAIQLVEYQIQNEFYIPNDETKLIVFRSVMLHVCKIWREELSKLIEDITILCPKCSKCKKDSLLADSRNLHIATFARARMLISDYADQKQFSNAESIMLKKALYIFNEAERETMDYVHNTIDKMHNLNNFNFCIKTVTANILTMYETMIVRMPIVVDDAVAKSNGYFKDKNFRGSNSFVEE